MGLYNDLDYKMERLSVEESAAFANRLAMDPRFKTSQERPSTTETIRTGSPDQLRESVTRALEGMQRAEARLRQEGVYRSDGRIITEDEARERGMRIRSGQEALPHADPHGFTRDPRWQAASRYGGDPRCAPGAYTAEVRQQMMAESVGTWGAQGRPASVPQAAPQQAAPAGLVPLQEAQQPRMPTLACGNIPMVGDVIQRGGDVLAEVEGASATGIRVEIPQMGLFEIPYGHLHEYTLLKRRGQ